MKDRDLIKGDRGILPCPHAENQPILDATATEIIIDDPTPEDWLRAEQIRQQREESFRQMICDLMDDVEYVFSLLQEHGGVLDVDGEWNRE